MYYQRGILYTRQKQYKNAINDYTKTIKLCKDYSDAYYKRGLTYAMMKKTKLAISDLKTARDLYSKQSNTDKYNEVDEFIKKVTK